VCPFDECIMVKHTNGQGAIVLILYVDDILILSNIDADRKWVKNILERKYEKITVTEGKRLPYLGKLLLKPLKVLK
jgi:hypothetical protein